MFENLQDKLQRTFKNLRGQGKITENNIDEALREVRLALLEADVHVKVVKTFLDSVKTKSMGQEVLQSLSPEEFRRYGRSGTWVSDLFPHLGSVIDDVCILNAVQGDHTGHDKATLGMHTGSFAFARPSMGSWVSYGLGTENRNLPSFVVIAPAAPYAGAQNWGNDFMIKCLGV